MSEIKIAVCLYGQPRTFKYCEPWIRRSFTFQPDRETRIWGKQKDFDAKIEYPSFTVDYFCDIKNQSTAGNFSGKWETPTENHSVEDISAIVDIFKPKKYIFTNGINEKRIHDKDHFFVPMFTSICKTVLLKQQVEIEEGVSYDWVFVTRYDNIIGPSISTLSEYVQNHGVRPLTIYSTGPMGRTINESFRPGFNDTIFWGDSLSIDMLSAKMYSSWATNNRDELNQIQNLGPNTFLANALFDAGLMYESAFVDYALVRPIADLTKPVLESWYYHKDFWLTEIFKTDLNLND